MPGERAAPSGVPDRVAIVMLTAVGDVVHVLPVVHSLRAANPRVHITWIIQPGPWELVKDHPAVDEFVVFDRERGWRAYAELHQAVRGKRYDLVLALQDYLKAGLITALLPAPRKVGIDRKRARDANWLFTGERIPTGPVVHTQELYAEFVRHLGIPLVLEWGLGPTEGERNRYGTLLAGLGAPIVALVLGTSRPEKEWPVARYAELVDCLHGELGATPVLVGGLSPRESRAAEEIAALAAHPPADLRAWDLRRVAFLIARADVLVSPDTGPLHIGVAVGTPSVALMGYTNPKRYGPYGRFGELVVDAFGEQGEEYPPSAPHRRGRMERITVKSVLERVRLALERYPKR